MTNDFFLPMYFKDLYPIEEQHKFDLYSPDFYMDARIFYCKILGESDRKMFLEGIKYLSVKIKLIEEIDLALEVWSSVENSSMGTELLRLKKPNPYSEFRIAVSNILDTAKKELIERDNKFRNRLIEKSKNDKIIIDSLLRDKRANNKTQLAPSLDVKIQTSTQFQEMDFTELLKKIRFDKNEETRKRTGEYLNQLGRTDYFTNCNAKEFAAIALIFFQTGWVINTGSFKKWLSIFAKAFNREDSTYKANRLKENMEFMRTKIPLLDKIPIK